MNTLYLFISIGGLIGVIVLFVVLRAVRFRLLNWGATQDEIQRSMPGDDLIPTPMLKSTRAVLVHASAADIWPWLVQMGYGRGHWYTYEMKLIERIWALGLQIFYKRKGHYARWRESWVPNADRIISELQNLKVGDIIQDGPEGTAIFTVKEIQPVRALVLHSIRHPITGSPVDIEAPKPQPHINFSWVFALNEIEDGQTRLIIRMWANVGPASVLPKLLGLLFLELTDFVMQRKMLLEIKQRTESPSALSLVSSSG